MKCVVVTHLYRMLSDTAEHREAMLSHRALKPVASLLRSDDTTLLLSAVKTLSCFIHRLECTFLSSALSFLLLVVLHYHICRDVYTYIYGWWNCAPKFCKLCATILKIMRALFANYVHIMHTFFGFVLHIIDIQQ